MKRHIDPLCVVRNVSEHVHTKDIRSGAFSRKAMSLKRLYLAHKCLSKCIRDQ